MGDKKSSPPATKHEREARIQEEATAHCRVLRMAVPEESSTLDERIDNRLKRLDRLIRSHHRLLSVLEERLGLGHEGSDVDPRDEA
jgi:hypothetical protein